MWQIIAGNIGSLGAMIFDSYSGTRKTKKDILIAQTISQLFYLASSVVMSSYSAAAQNLVAIFRNIYGSSEKQSKFIDWLLVVAPVVLGLAFNVQGLLGLVPIVANLQYSIIVLLYKSKERIIKISFAICCGLFIIFNFLVKNYVATVSCIIVVVTTCIALRKEKVKAEQISEVDKDGRQKN